MFQDNYRFSKQIIDTEKSLKCIRFCFVRKLIAVENFLIAIFNACFCFSIGVEQFGQLKCLNCLNEKMAFKQNILYDYICGDFELTISIDNDISAEQITYELLQYMCMYILTISKKSDSTHCQPLYTGSSIIRSAFTLLFSRPIQLWILLEAFEASTSIWERRGLHDLPIRLYLRVSLFFSFIFIKL